MAITCLVGNGVSMSYNMELSTHSLTRQLLSMLNDQTGTRTAEALRSFANSVTSGGPDDFEELLGPFDSISRGLSILGQLEGPFSDFPNIMKPLHESSVILNNLYRVMLANVLTLIDLNAQDHGQEAMGNVRMLTDALIQASEDDLLTIGTLNYDSLLMAALPDGKYTDLADGRSPTAVSLAESTILAGYPLRTELDFPENYQIRLIHLHGSLGWLYVGGLGSYKFGIQSLRDCELWDRMLRGELNNVRPLVVLTNNKDSMVNHYPYQLTYTEFSNRLIQSEYWCIAGYSFRDECVNRILLESLSFRNMLSDPTKIFVLGKGFDSTQRENIESMFSDSCQLTLSDDGVPDGVGNDAWERWLT